MREDDEGGIEEGEGEDQENKNLAAQSSKSVQATASFHWCCELRPPVVHCGAKERGISMGI